jgi:hypothetical protein
MLQTGELYRELGGDYLTQRDPEKTTKRLVRSSKRSDTASRSSPGRLWPDGISFQRRFRLPSVADAGADRKQREEEAEPCSCRALSRQEGCRHSISDPRCATSSVSR